MTVVLLLACDRGDDGLREVNEQGDETVSLATSPAPRVISEKDATEVYRALRSGGKGAREQLRAWLIGDDRLLASSVLRQMSVRPESCSLLDDVSVVEHLSEVEGLQESLWFAARDCGAVSTTRWLARVNRNSANESLAYQAVDFLCERSKSGREDENCELRNKFRRRACGAEMRVGVIFDWSTNGDDTFVDFVCPGMAAERAGLVRGDLLETIGATQVTPDNVVELMNISSGRIVTLGVKRDGKHLVLRLDLKN